MILEEAKFEKAESLDVRAVEAKKSEVEKDNLLTEFTPFLRNQVARYSARYDKSQSKLLFTVAMEAFHEAITNYDPAKEHFFSFADRVVRSSLAEHISAANKDEGMAVSPGEEYAKQKSTQSDAKKNTRSYSAERRQEMLVEEIEQFKAEIKSWGFTMESLVKASPKNKQAKKSFNEILSAVYSDYDIIQTIRLKKCFPTKIISKNTGLPQNILERARIFIIASLILKMGDYDLLSGFLH